MTYSCVLQRIRQWFRNQKRTPKIGKGQKNQSASKQSGSKNSIFTKKRMWQPIESYRNLTYEEIWKDIIDVEYRYYRQQCIEKDDDEDGDAVAPMGRFQYTNTFMKARLDEEDEEMKQRVEEHRQKMKESPPSDEVNVMFQESEFFPCSKRVTHQIISFTQSDSVAPT